MTKHESTLIHSLLMPHKCNEQLPEGTAEKSQNLTLSPSSHTEDPKLLSLQICRQSSGKLAKMNFSCPGSETALC